LSAGPRGRLRRFLFRLPITLHHAGVRGYERILGIDWILVTTRGRRTGQPREVMVDELGHDSATGTVFVAPANGERSEWVRNVRASPEIEFVRRGVRFSARARDASGDEGAEVYVRFFREHPRYARFVAMLGPFEDVSTKPEDEARAYFRTLVVIALEPRLEGTQDASRPRA